jgi:hypothetical protein
VREVLAQDAADGGEATAEVVAATAVGSDGEADPADVWELPRAQRADGIEHDAAAGRWADPAELAAEEERAAGARQCVDRLVRDVVGQRRGARRRRLR